MLNRIEVNPKIMCGKAVIKGTRIPVYVILELITAGYDFKKIVEAYPDITEDDIREAIEYATGVIKGEEVIEVKT